MGPDNIAKYHPPAVVFTAYVGPSISTPIFCQDKLLIAGYHGIRLYQFDSDGNFRLLDKLGAVCESTPIVHDGRVYIASRNGYLYCLGEEMPAVDN